VASTVVAGIAVAGTLLGSALTYLFQRRSAVAAQALAFSQQLRAERLAAYSGLVTALTEFRRAEIRLYHAELEDPGGTAAAAAQAEEFRTRSAALTSLAQVRMATGDPGVMDAAIAAWNATESVRTWSETDPVTGAIRQMRRRGRMQPGRRSTRS
jgi:hypothetical protein